MWRLQTVNCYCMSLLWHQREEAEFSRKMQSEQQQAAVEEQKLEQRRQEEMLQYHRELEQQLVDGERKRQEAYEEFLKEKLMVDEIVRKIYEDDQMWAVMLTFTLVTCKMW